MAISFIGVPHGRAWAARGLVIATVGAMSAVACSLITDLSPIAPKGDAAADTGVIAPPEGFSLVASPAHVTLDPGDAIDITVSIVRGKQFTGLVDVNVNDVGGLSGLTTSPPVLTFTADAPVTLHVDAAKDAKTPQDGNVTLLGVARGDTTKTATTKFGVRLGSVLIDTTTSTQVTVPAYATRVWIKAWGAGGGAGGSCAYQDVNGQQVSWGSPGGAGGMASGLFSVNPSEALSVVVGTPGPTPMNNCGSFQQCRGGGGGGYTAVMRGMTPLLIAGGGGGGGTGIVRGQNCDYGDQGQRGAAGGGADGEPRQYGFNPQKNMSATTTTGGTAGGGSATAGGPLLGGNGGNASAGMAGAPGGGVGGIFTCCTQTGGGGGGGGGGGWFGGGGGGQVGNFISYNGGGGGSGFLDGGADAAQAAGTANTPPATTDPDYRAGTAVGGVAAATPIAAGVGRVFVRMTKP